jgi:hypothetical protein
MPLDHKRFTRRRPEDPTRPQETRLIQKAPFDVKDQIVAKDSSGSTGSLSISTKNYEGQHTSDLRTQDLLCEVLYELKHIRLHMEALSGEDLRGDVDYADQ